MAAEKFVQLRAWKVLSSAFLLVLVSGCVSSQKTPAPSQTVAVAPAPVSTETVAEGYSIQVSPAQVPDGSIVLIDVSFKQPFSGKVSATFEDKTFSFYPIGPKGESTHFQAAFGVPHNHKLGSAEVTVSVDGMKTTTAGFTVVDGNYKSEVLKVAARKVNPLKRDMVRIKRELGEIGEIYKIETPEKYWDGPFQLPLHSIITDPFGTKRLYNGQLKNYHGGLDFRAAVGTPIFSAGAGKVVLAKDLFYSGNTVIIDHGYGLLTMYFHMSKLGVKKGQMVSAHEQLGLSGKTGRVTGPHLHWQAVIHQVKVNPMGLVEELK
jgi:murein DD-endopeptidase MepM/ murein hydrolase activator NlpD